MSENNQKSEPGGERVGWVLCAACLTGLFAIVEVAGGVYSGSLSLLADAGYMFVDTLALITAWKLIKRNVQRDHEDDNPHASELENKFGRIAGTLLLVIGLTLIGVAIFRFNQERLLISGKLMFWLGVIGMIVNLICLRILLSCRLQDERLVEVKQHVLCDIIGSIAVVAAALAIVFGTATFDNTRFVYVDLILAIAIALLMLFNGFVALRETGDNSQSLER